MFSCDLDSFDFRAKNPEQIINTVMTKLDKQGKGIILMHDFQKHTAEALPTLLRRLKAGGYKVVQMKAKAPLQTLPEYDEAMVKDMKLPVASTRPVGSVVQTVSRIGRRRSDLRAQGIRFLTARIGDAEGGSVFASGAVKVRENSAQRLIGRPVNIAHEGRRQREQDQHLHHQDSKDGQPIEAAMFRALVAEVTARAIPFSEVAPSIDRSPDSGVNRFTSLGNVKHRPDPARVGRCQDSEYVGALTNRCRGDAVRR